MQNGFVPAIQQLPDMADCPALECQGGAAGYGGRQQFGKPGFGRPRLPYQEAPAAGTQGNDGPDHHGTVGDELSFDAQLFIPPHKLFHSTG